MRVAERRIVTAVAIAAGASTILLGCGPSSDGGGTGTGGSASAHGGTTGSAGNAGSAGTGGSERGGTTGSAATGGGAGTSSTAGTTGTAGTSAGSGGAIGSAGSGGGGAAGNDGRGGAAGTANGGRGGAGGRGGGSAAGAGGRGGSAAGAGGRGGSGGGAAGTGGGGQSCASSTLTSGNSNKTISVGGVNRTYILHVPTSYTGTKPVPLVIDFHALGGSGSQEQGLSGYQAIADREGFPILFPDGIDNAWNIGPCCTNSRTVDDLGFAKAMVAAIVGQACIDTKRVYATGFSMGGGMSHYLACNAADIFAAVQPSSFDLLVPDEEPCTPARPISVLTYRGTADTTVPYAGGKGPSGKITFLGAQGSFMRWADLDGCMTPTTVDGDCTYYKTCTAGVQVGLCVKQGGGHAPGDANIGWTFLSKFSLP
jgi:polyhydroxybutyrate depolymerase